jgi:hypothetical protein
MSDIHPIVDERRGAALPRQPADRVRRREQLSVGQRFLADLDQPNPDPEEPPRNLNVIVDS